MEKGSHGGGRRVYLCVMKEGGRQGSGLRKGGGSWDTEGDGGREAAWHWGQTWPRQKIVMGGKSQMRKWLLQEGWR